MLSFLRGDGDQKQREPKQLKPHHLQQLINPREIRDLAGPVAVRNTLQRSASRRIVAQGSSLTSRTARSWARAAALSPSCTSRSSPG
jgi:hypothetical protein